MQFGEINLQIHDSVAGGCRPGKEGRRARRPGRAHTPCDVPVLLLSRSRVHSLAAALPRWPPAAAAQRSLSWGGGRWRAEDGLLWGLGVWGGED